MKLTDFIRSKKTKIEKAPCPTPKPTVRATTKEKTSFITPVLNKLRDDPNALWHETHLTRLERHIKEMVKILTILPHSARAVVMQSLINELFRNPQTDPLQGHPTGHLNLKHRNGRERPPRRKSKS